MAAPALSTVKKRALKRLAVPDRWILLYFSLPEVMESRSLPEAC